MPPPEDVIRGLAREWIRKGEEDRRACMALLKEPTDVKAVAAFHAQQMAEKYLKALLTFRQTEFPKTHSIGFLLSLLERSDPGISGRLRVARLLTRYAISTRYPGDEDLVTPEEATQALQTAEEVRSLVVAVIPPP